MAYDYDLIVLGGGPAGEKGAAQAAYFGKRVALVEGAHDPGGACVHTGTLPSKTLREAALVLSGYRSRDLYGIHVDLDRDRATPKLLSRKEAVRREEVGRIRWNLDRHAVTTLHGHGRFVDPHTIEVASPGGKPLRVTGEYVLIATGSAPHHPEGIPFDDPAVDDSDTILGIARLPDRMTILGAGVIGCEYACMFAALGTAVTLVDPRPELLSFLDAEFSERLRQAMNAIGVETRLGVAHGGVSRVGDVIRTELADGSVVDADRVLFAAGRSGRTRDLGLETIGITPDKRGTLEVDRATFRTRVPNVYAAGDVIGFPALASTSMEQARVAVVHAFDLGYKQHVGELLPYGIYTIPEVSFAGLSEEDAIAKGIDVVVGRAFFRDNARGKISGEREGLIKLVFERGTRKLIGVHCLGERAAELVHVGLAIMTLGGGVDALIEMVFNYPTLAESFKYAAYDALGRFSSAPAR